MDTARSRLVPSTSSKPLPPPFPPALLLPVCLMISIPPAPFKLLSCPWRAFTSPCASGCVTSAVAFTNIQDWTGFERSSESKLTLSICPTFRPRSINIRRGRVLTRSRPIASSNYRFSPCAPNPTWSTNIKAPVANMRAPSVTPPPMNPNPSRTIPVDLTMPKSRIIPPACRVDPRPFIRQSDGGRMSGLYSWRTAANLRCRKIMMINNILSKGLQVAATRRAGTGSRSRLQWVRSLHGRQWDPAGSVARLVRPVGADDRGSSREQ